MSDCEFLFNDAVLFNCNLPGPHPAMCPSVWQTAGRKAMPKCLLRLKGLEAKTWWQLMGLHRRH